MFIAILVLAFYIAKPFLPALLTGAIVAYLSYPLYNATLRHIRNKNVVSLLIAIFIVLILTIPSIIVLGLVSNEAYAAYTTLTEQKLGTNFMAVICQDESSLSCKSIKSVISTLPEDNLDYYLQVTIEKITAFVIESVSSFVASVPLFLLNFFVMVYAVYYLLKDGEIIAKKIKNILPLKESHKQHVLERFHSITSAVFYGNIFVAVIQGILGIIGFFIFGVKAPILWGFVMMVFALVPYIGTAIIWLPAALNLIFIGYLQNDNSFIVRGIMLIVYGVFIISTADNLLKPKLIGAKARVHPLLVLIGILGGLNLFGLIGFILGPLMLALVITFIDIYEEEKAEIKKYF